MRILGFVLRQGVLCFPYQEEKRTGEGSVVLPLVDWCLWVTLSERFYQDICRNLPDVLVRLLVDVYEKYKTL